MTHSLPIITPPVIRDDEDQVLVSTTEDSHCLYLSVLSDSTATITLTPAVARDLIDRLVSALITVADR